MDAISMRAAIWRSSAPALMAIGHRLGPSPVHATAGAATAEIEDLDRKGNALIVEDEFLTSWHLSDMMTGLGYHVVGVSATGEDAIRLASETRPDVILMDVNLKGTLDGIEAAQAIRSNAPAVIIFVSAYTDDETVRRMQTVDGCFRIGKPVTSRDLKTVLDTAFDES